MPIQYTFCAALILASVYVFGNRLRMNTDHRTWISIAAGVSVSTIFIDLLPEISENQASFITDPQHRGAALFPEQAVYIAAMIGFVLFYGLEYLVASSQSREESTNRLFSGFRLAAFATYSAFISYLLVHNVWKDSTSFLFYSLAMAFHLLLVNHSLADNDGESYQHWGRWILAGSVFVGWLAGIFTLMPEQWLARVTGFICGSVIMNTLVVELPEGRGGRFWPFVAAAAVYSILLIVILR